MVFGNDEQRERRLILAAVTIILLLSLSALATFRLLAGLAGVPGGSDNIVPRQDYLQIVQSLTPLINHERREKRIPSIAVALVDDQETVWAQGFGFADWLRNRKQARERCTVWARYQSSLPISGSCVSWSR